MFSIFNWSNSRYLESQLQKHQAYKSQYQDAKIPSMDVSSSIITQVAREGEHINNGYIFSGKGPGSKSLQSSKKKKRKGERQNTTFRSMLCCFGKPRRKSTLHDKHIQESRPLSNGRIDHAPMPSAVVNPTHDNNDNTVTNGNHEQRYLLPPKPQDISHKKCAVIDLDETLVHSSFKPISNADFVVPVEIDGTVHQVYVLKRPHVDTYLQRMGEMYECVLFTASLAKYADPVADLLDRHNVFSARLFRESCVFHKGNYVKDLSLIGRDLNKVIIIDNSPASYIFHPDNAVPVISWFDDPSDTELLDLLPFLEAIAESQDVYSVLQSHGFTSHAKQTTASIQQQLRPPIALQNSSDEDSDER